jgi:hypothetical protein
VKSQFFRPSIRRLASVAVFSESSLSSIDTPEVRLNPYCAINLIEWDSVRHAIEPPVSLIFENYTCDFERGVQLPNSDRFQSKNSNMNLRAPTRKSSVTSGRTVRCLKIGPIRWPGQRVSHLALNAVRDTKKARIWKSVSLWTPPGSPEGWGLGDDKQCRESTQSLNEF